jgi:hypothetical protein
MQQLTLGDTKITTAELQANVDLHFGRTRQSRHDTDAA